MPYKSKAQQRFFHAAAAKGDISKATVTKWDSESKGKKIPERKHPKAYKSIADIKKRYKEI